MTEAGAPGLPQRPGTMNACRICGNDRANRLHYPREMFSGSNEMFEYFECGQCGCLQIARAPEDLGRYYPRDYYAYESPRQRRQPALVAWLREARSRAYLGERDLLGSLLALLFRRPEHFGWLARGNVRLDSRILDVGCGRGGLLLKLRREGFRNLLGIDPWIENDIDYGNGVQVLKKSVDEISDSFDFVMLHHSFEHMPDAHRAMDRLRRLVADRGMVLLRVPVADSYARRKYGVCWVAWDAPRHQYLHTVRSLHVLAGVHGFELVEVTYDSTVAQFVGSEAYLRGISSPSKARPGMSACELARFRRFAEELNRLRDGDTACFYLRPR